MNKKQKIVIVVGFFIIALAQFMFAIASLQSTYTTDYSHPKAEWQTTKSGKVQASVDFTTAEEKEKNLIILQKEQWHLPIAFSWNQLLFGGIILGFIFLILMGSFFDLKYEGGERRTAFLVAFIPFLASVVIIILTIISFHNSHNYKELIFHSVADQKLANEVVETYNQNIVLCPAFTIILSFGIFAALIGVHWWIRYEVELFTRISNLVKSVKDKYIETVIARVKKTGGLVADQELIELVRDGKLFQVVSYNYKLRWALMPVVMPTRTVIASASFDEFLNLFIEAAKRNFLHKIKESFFEKFREYFKVYDNSFVTNFITNLLKVISQKFDGLLENTELQKDAPSRQIVEKEMGRLVLSNLRLFKRQLANIGQTKIFDMLSALKGGLRRELISEAKKLVAIDVAALAGTEQTANILPPNTRFYLERGNSQVVVIEQAPAVRSVKISRTVSGDYKNTYSLAFPYVVFILFYQDNYFQSLRVYYRTKPLKSLKDDLYRPNFTNLNDNSTVCLNFPGTDSTNIVGQTEDILSHFWNSEFNSDLNSYYKRYAQKIPSISSIEEWEKSSKKNPLFALSLPWEKYKNLEDQITPLLDSGGSRPRISLEKVVTNHVEQAFSSNQAEMVEALQLALSKVDIKESYPQKIMEAIIKRDSEVINESLVVAKSSLPELKDNKDIKHLRTLVTELTLSVFDEAFSLTKEQMFIISNLSFDEVIRKIKQLNNKN